MKEKMLYQKWLEEKSLDPEIRQQLLDMKDNEQEIFDSFYRDLEFGTAGLRGVLGAGTNRMNIYTVGQATQGFSMYLKENFSTPSVAIAYDSRHCSELFAWTAARVLAYNGIRVYMYAELMPTPMLSYAVRYYHCDGGIVITASHNPAKYNGYKVYGPDGCQAGPEMADAILACINRTDMFSVKQARTTDPHIQLIPDSVVESFLDTIVSLRVDCDEEAVSALKVVYTPLNGTGRVPVARMMKKIGLQNVTVVSSQEMPDGSFSTCPYPNPENRDALEEGLKVCREVHPDILLATDPDADRVGVAVNHHGEYILPSGNDMGVLMLDYICKMRRKNGTMPAHPVAVKSIVTTAMVDDVAAYYGVKLEAVLTGFKFIGGVIAALEEEGRAEDYLFGFEESYGYLLSGHVRDKDAVSASMLICDMTAYYKKQGKTLIDVLNELYDRFGVYSNRTISVSFEGAAGMEKMKSIMDSIRENPPQEVGGAAVAERNDYLLSRSVSQDGEKVILLPKSNVLGFRLSDGCSFVIRPSGTEPKLKFYIFAKAETKEDADARVSQLQKALAGYTK